MKINDLNKHYSKLIGQHETTEKKYKQQRFWLGFIRFTAFGLFGWALVSWIVSGTSWIYTIPTFAVFLLFVSLDRRVEDKLRLVKELLSINEDELKLIKGELKHRKDGSEFLDPRHPYCDDLNLFGRGSLFQQINRTTTQHGKWELGRMMKSVSSKAEHIKNLQEAILELSEKDEWRQNFRASGNLVKETDYKTEDVVGWFKNNPHKLNGPIFKAIIYLLPFVNVSLVTLFIFNVVNASLGFSFFLLLLFIYGGYAKTINWYNQSLQSFSSSIKKYDVLIRTLLETDFESKLTRDIKQILSQDNGNAFKEIKKAKRLLNQLESRNNIIVAIGLNGLYLRDLHIIKAIDTWQKNNIDQFPKWFEAIAKLDALNSLAGFAFNHPNYVLPELSETNLLDARDLGHPLIDAEERIDNDIRYSDTSFFYIVTGANMAGKSTFLRTVSVNLIMASMGLPVCAKSFVYKPVQLFTSIGTFDDLIEHTSYFKAELLRLKKLYDTASNGEPLFIVLDEILKGTNSEDKRKGSLGVLKKLIQKPVYGLVATHDLDLGKLENEFPDSFKNICFEIAFNDDEMLFDYMLRDGITQNMNASYLLKNMGLI